MALLALENSACRVHQMVVSRVRYGSTTKASRRWRAFYLARSRRRRWRQRMDKAAERRARRAAAARARRQNAAVRAREAEAVRRRRQDPAVREREAEAARQRREDPAVREREAEAARQRRQDDQQNVRERDAARKRAFRQADPDAARAREAAAKRARRARAEGADARFKREFLDVSFGYSCGSLGGSTKRVEPYITLDVLAAVSKPPPSRTEPGPDHLVHALSVPAENGHGSVGSSVERSADPPAVSALRTAPPAVPPGNLERSMTNENARALSASEVSRRHEDARDMSASEVSRRPESDERRTPSSGTHTPELKVFKIRVPHFAGESKYLKGKGMERSWRQASGPYSVMSMVTSATTVPGGPSAPGGRVIGEGGLTNQHHASPRDKTARPRLTPPTGEANQASNVSERDQQPPCFQQRHGFPMPLDLITSTEGHTNSTSKQRSRSLPTQPSPDGSRQGSLDEDSRHGRAEDEGISGPLPCVSVWQRSSPKTPRKKLRSEDASTEDGRLSERVPLSALSFLEARRGWTPEHSRLYNHSSGKHSPHWSPTPPPRDSPGRRASRQQRQQPHKAEPAKNRNPQLPSQLSSCSTSNRPSQYQLSSTETRPDLPLYLETSRHSIHPACVEASRNMISPHPFQSSSTQGSSSKGLKVSFWRHPPVVSISCVVFLVTTLIGSLFLLGILFNIGNSRWSDVSGLCRTEPCREFARRLRDSVNRSVSPCVSFTRFVCDGWRRRSLLSVREQFFLSELQRLSYLLISKPLRPKAETGLEKAAAFYCGCEAVRRGDADELENVKGALEQAGITWPRLPNDFEKVDLLRTWLHASLMLRWSAVLDISVEGTPNITRVTLEQTSDFFRILLKHESLKGIDYEAKLYFETLRREFGDSSEYQSGRKNTTVSFATTSRLANTHLSTLANSFRYPPYPDNGLEAVFMFSAVPGLDRQRWLNELGPYAGAGNNSVLDVIFVADNPSFVRAFLGLWKRYGEHQMHLFFSWCTVQTAALYANRKLLANFYGREQTVNLYHGALCLSKAYLLSGSEVFHNYYDEVLSEEPKRAAQRLVSDTRLAFADRLNQSLHGDTNRTVVQDWNSTDVALGYFDPRFHPQPRQAARISAPNTRSMCPSIVDSWQAALPGPTISGDRAASLHIEFADWYALLPGRDLALLPYALSFPSFDAGSTRAMNHGGLGYHVASALSRLFVHSYKRSPEAMASFKWSLVCTANATNGRGDDFDRLRYLEDALALEVSLQAYQHRSAVSGDNELLEGFEGYSGTAMFFIVSCYFFCLGSDNVHPSIGGNECDYAFRNADGFATAFNCEPGSPMNPVDKCGFMMPDRAENDTFPTPDAAA